MIAKCIMEEKRVLIQKYKYFYWFYNWWFFLKANWQYFRIKDNSEEYEVITTMQYAQENWFLVYPIFNELSLGRAFRLIARRQVMWLKKWIADLFFILPWKAIFFIEMKKELWKKWWQNWSVVSNEQIYFQEQIHNTWGKSYICHWFTEAREILDSYL